MKGKIINCCGDCVYYDWKKHKCKNGYSRQDNPQDHFYDDCNVFKDLEEHDKEVYNKAIDDCIKEVEEEEKQHNHTITKDCLFWLKRKLEQLKAGGKNETDNQ